MYRNCDSLCKVQMNRISYVYTHILYIVPLILLQFGLKNIIQSIKRILQIITY